MLQIKKKGTLTSCKYNLQFLFRNKQLSKLYSAKKTLTESIFLRAPKHFNIGKQKIVNLNYKTPTLLLKFNNNLNTTTLSNSHNFLFNCLRKQLQLTPTVLIRSLRVTVKTKFKLKWLEILSFC